MFFNEKANNIYLYPKKIKMRNVKQIMRFQDSLNNALF